MYSTTISLAPPLARSKPRARITALPGFAAGTMLRTITGPRAIERIMAGDLLLDADDQIIELRSLRHRIARPSELVEITPAALGLGLAPSLRQTSLIVGAGQKLGMRDWRSALIYGQPTLTQALALVDEVTVQRPERSAMLYRLGFDRDCVVVANGLPALVRASDA